MVLALVHLVKHINKPLYYGFNDKSTNKTNIVYFKNKEDAHKCKVSVNNYYDKYKRSPKISELNFSVIYEHKSSVIFKVQSMDENYMNNFIHLGNLNTCNLVIDKKKKIWCMQEHTINTNKHTPLHYFNVLYAKAYSEEFYN